MAKQAENDVRVHHPNQSGPEVQRRSFLRWVPVGERTALLEAEAEARRRPARGVDYDPLDDDQDCIFD